MSVGIYLLDLTDLGTPDLLKRFLKEALPRVDEVRRGKAEKIKSPEGQAASLGAGLLLQKMAADYQGGAEIQGERRYTAGELLAALQGGEALLSLRYRFGIHGKPEIVDFPMHFSLSHSGDYVLCAVSGREVGADIQKLQPVDAGKLAGRFYSAAECRLLEACGSDARRQRLFFEMWTRKEALGKLTGQGVAAVLGLCVTENRGGEKIDWQEIRAPEGYAAAVCVGEYGTGKR